MCLDYYACIVPPNGCPKDTPFKCPVKCDLKLELNIKLIVTANQCLPFRQLSPFPLPSDENRRHSLLKISPIKPRESGAHPLHHYLSLLPF